MKILHTIGGLLLFLCIGATCFAHNEIPGEKQKKPIALTNAKLYTVTGGVIERGTIVFDNGKITAFGISATIPQGAEVIDCKGSSVYPGFIAPNSVIGLTEVDAVRATRDMNEVGSVNPNARAAVAYNPDSEIIPTVRTNGILIANVVPQGGMVGGTTSLMMLDGWTREDISLNGYASMAITFPNLATFTAPWMQKSADDQRKDNDKAVQALYDYFTKAQMYSKAAQSALTDNARDIRLEAMRAVFEKNMPVMIQCGEYKQIIAAIEFAKKFQLNAILVGCEDAWRCTREIKASGYPVIIGRVHSLPRRDDEPYDITYKLPQILATEGIVFAFSDGGAWQQRNLPFQAGSAVAFGLKEEDAVKALTINPASMFGAQKQVGSLEVGKDATLFVSTGNALDALGNKLEYAFIQGRKMSLETKQTRLAEKYRTKYKQQR
ncbi:MAG: amidohydrolase family protein [Candidatus Kapabacteria bacterium]|nr:amidohydrolase family protein [Candidatus Kapabacteria bacterium]